MSTGVKGTSVFTDDSGARKRIVTLAIRGATTALSLGAAAVAVSAFGHVTLPGLDAPLHIPGAGHAKTSTKDAGQAPERSTSDGKAAAELDPSGSPTERSTKTDSNSANPTVATTGPTTAPPTGKPTAKPTTAAHPVHAPGTPPTAPPGKSKITDSGQ